MGILASARRGWQTVSAPHVRFAALPHAHRSCMKKIFLVAGARPNFMKIAPIVRALQARTDALEFEIVHTGQHYDREMSDVFFDELGIPAPHHHLECGG